MLLVGALLARRLDCAREVREWAGEWVTRQASTSCRPLRAVLPCAPSLPQAVALGAAVQAGVYEGQVSELMVMDVWQAQLMRAFAAQLAREQGLEGSDVEEGGESGAQGGGAQGSEGWSDDGEEGWEEEAASGEGAA